jgi:hypothetical protein
MKTIHTLFFLLLLVLPAASWGATRTVGPSDCSVSAVNSAIASASDGDIVELTCAGTVTWATTLTLPNTKGITLRVAGGTNTPKTSASFPLTVSSSADPIIQVNCENSKALTRITGFKLTNTIASSNGAIYVQGRGTGKDGLGAYRIDNNYFYAIQLPHASLSGTLTLNASTGVMTGLVDNNSFRDWSYAGMNAWTRAFSFGGSDFAFLEDNLFENINQYTRHIVMGIEGGKYVVRYNTFTIDKDNNGVRTQIVEAHGNCICSSIGAGTRGGEIYHNTFQGSKLHNSVFLRGGTWLVYDNSFLNASGSVNGHMCIKDYRAGSVCSQCSATCVAQAATWRKCAAAGGTDYPLDQQIMGTYFWNNLYSGANVEPVVDNDLYNSSYIQKNRDYFVAAAKPASLTYSSYTYPHPLRSVGATSSTTTTAGTPPAPPTGLKIMY